MKINELYIEQTNRFCEANCKITAEDILAKAKQRQAENVLAKTPAEKEKMQITTSSEEKETIKETTSKKTGKVITLPSGKKVMFRLSHVAAAFLAIFLLTGTTILAFSGKIGQFLGDAGATVIAFDESKMEIFFRDILGDESTAEIVGQGHIYEINKVLENDEFKVELIAVTGDRNVPHIIFDVYLNDEAMAAANDRIFVNAYILGVDAYENDKDGYACSGAYGIKDPETDNLYHVNMETTPGWLIYGKEAVIDVCSIFTDIDPAEEEDLSYWEFSRDDLMEMGYTPEFTIHETNFVYRETVPEDAFAWVISRKYHDVVFSSEKRDYTLESIEYGYYRMDMVFSFDYPEGTPPASESIWHSTEGILQGDWVVLSSNMYLIVDGEEYKLTEDNIGWVNWDYKGSRGPVNRCYIFPSLPNVDYYDAESIILKVGDVSYNLKESEL